MKTMQSIREAKRMLEVILKLLKGNRYEDATTIAEELIKASKKVDEGKMSIEKYHIKKDKILAKYKKAKAKNKAEEN